MTKPELLIKSPMIVCPATNLYGPGVVGVRDGKITFRNADITEPDSPTAEVLNFDDGILLPGLVDLHAHPALENSRYGIDPDEYLLPRGSTTVLSQGDAGARNLDEYIHHTIESSRTNVKLAINFCANGESNPDGRFFDLSEASVSECVAAIERGGAHVWGLSLNIALIRGNGVDPIEVLERGIRAAEATGHPVMFGATKSSELPLADQLKRLRAGDVMTYCFHSGEGSIVEDGRVLDCAWEARERGVLFDVGDGFAAFGFDVAEIAIAEGFLPDTISSDFYRAHVSARIDHDLPLVVSKLIASGMAAEECWPRITSVPAKILGLGDEVGRIQAGVEADLCALILSEEPEALKDGHNQVRMGRRWRPVATLKSGELVQPGI